MEYDVLRRSVAEFVGAFTLIFIGGGAGIVSGQDIVAVALANGLAIGIMVSNLGHISGGHFNPAITLGFLITRRLAPVLALVYWILQFAAAAAAALLLRWIYDALTRNTYHLGAPGLAANISTWQGVVVSITCPVPGMYSGPHHTSPSFSSVSFSRSSARP